MNLTIDTSGAQRALDQVGRRVEDLEARLRALQSVTDTPAPGDVGGLLFAAGVLTRLDPGQPVSRRRLFTFWRHR